MTTLRLRTQEIKLSDPRSRYTFVPSRNKPFVATRAAVNTFGAELVCQGLRVLQERARRERGLDYVQVFDVDGKDQPLWFIEDGPGGAITALLPSDY